jgi:hypothetical protein
VSNPALGGVTAMVDEEARGAKMKDVIIDLGSFLRPIMLRRNKTWGWFDQILVKLPRLATTTFRATSPRSSWHGSSKAELVNAKRDAVIEGADSSSPPAH